MHAYRVRATLVSSALVTSLLQGLHKLGQLKIAQCDLSGATAAFLQALQVLELPLPNPWPRLPQCCPHRVSSLKVQPGAMHVYHDLAQVHAPLRDNMHWRGQQGMRMDVCWQAWYSSGKQQDAQRTSERLDGLVQELRRAERCVCHPWAPELLLSQCNAKLKRSLMRLVSIRS